MDELKEARAELARLESRAKELLVEFMDVRAAISRQRTNISELVRRRPPAIRCLPAEILSSILKLDIEMDPDPNRKQRLAGVSRRWRDMVLNSPTLWVHINLFGYDVSLIRTHLRRSVTALLDIVMNIDPCWPENNYDPLLSRLAMVMPHAHRWKSLSVIDPREESDITLYELVSNAMNHLKFPSLKYVYIPIVGDMPYPSFLSQTHAPVLEHLDFRDYHPATDFLPAPTLKTLKLSLFYDTDTAPCASFPSLIPTYALTTLTLEGRMTDWSLRSNSIQFPALTVLTLQISDTNRFLAAIVAPNLERINYYAWKDPNPPSIVFDGVRFDSVRCLRLAFGSAHPDRDLGAVHLCEAFPSVYHVELNSRDLINLFAARSANSGSTQDWYPIDLWTDLRSLTLGSYHTKKWILVFDYLLRWLSQRRTSGLPILHVKIPSSFDLFGHPRDMVEDILRLHESLKGKCILEFNVPIEGKLLNPVGADSSLWLVSACTARVSRIDEFYGVFILAFTRITLGQ